MNKLHNIPTKNTYAIMLYVREGGQHADQGDGPSGHTGEHHADRKDKQARRTRRHVGQADWTDAQARRTLNQKAEGRARLDRGRYEHTENYRRDGDQIPP